MSAKTAPELPPRFEAVARLGKGGGGEVWRVRDRVKKITLALKLLAEDFPQGRPATLFLAFALCGGAFILAPRLLRKTAPEPAPGA